jgi:hypothetical protein
MQMSVHAAVWQPFSGPPHLVPQQVLQSPLHLILARTLTLSCLSDVHPVWYSWSEPLAIIQMTA